MKKMPPTPAATPKMVARGVRSSGGTGGIGPGGLGGEGGSLLQEQ